MNRQDIAVIGVLMGLALGASSKVVLPRKPRFDGQSEEARDEALEKAELKRQARATKRLKNINALGGDQF